VIGVDRLSLDRNTHNLLDRLVDAVEDLSEEVERLNENIERRDR
jgi:uncharacterized protein YoxC